MSTQDIDLEIARLESEKARLLRLKTISREVSALSVADKNFQKLVRVIQEQLGVSLSQMVGKNRQRPFVNARFIAQHIMYFRQGLTLSHIGRIFSRDHSAINHAITTASALIKTDRQFRAEFNLVSAEFDKVLSAGAPTNDAGADSSNTGLVSRSQGPRTERNSRTAEAL